MHKISLLAALMVGLTFGSYSYADYQSDGSAAIVADEYAAKFEHDGPITLSHQGIDINSVTQSTRLNGVEIHHKQKKEAYLKAGAIELYNVTLEQSALENTPQSAFIKILDGQARIPDYMLIRQKLSGRDLQAMDALIRVDRSEGVIDFNVDAGFNYSSAESALTVNVLVRLGSLASMKVSFSLNNVPDLVGVNLMNFSNKNIIALALAQLMMFSDTVVEVVDLHFTDGRLLNIVSDYLMADPRIRERMTQEGLPLNRYGVRQFVALQIREDIKDKADNSLLRNLGESLAAAAGKDRPEIQLSLKAISAGSLTVSRLLRIGLTGKIDDLAKHGQIALQVK